MNLKEMIGKRKSCRSYTGAPVSAELLGTIMSAELTPLYPDIRVRWDIVGRDKVKCICPWTTPQVITVYSEEKDGYLENVGFLFQQLELYLQSLGLGVCWLGMGRLNPKAMPETEEGLKFVIMLAFGYPKGEYLRADGKGFKRRSLNQISDREDARLEPARLAPSSVNSQPWFFVHEGENIHVYVSARGVIGDMNRIDMGIALAHLFVANGEHFRFFWVQQPPVRKGCGYIGTVNLNAGEGV